MPFQSLKNIDVSGKTVLLRADLNVPAQKGKVTDTTRIDRLKPTIDYLTERKARVLIVSHFGRPEGEQNPEMSLAFLIPVLHERWGASVRFSPECVGETAEQFSTSLNDGDIGLLENVRFHKEEKANDPNFAKQLASLADIYVNDAFSASHRAHASTEGVAQHLPCAAGLLMEEELTALEQALENPEKPVAAIAGGSKISTKLTVLNNLIEKTDYLILGGGMANTFLYAMGCEMGASLCEKNMVDDAKAIMKKAKEKGCKIILPQDCVCVKEIAPNAEYTLFLPSGIPSDMRAIDIGPKAILEITEILKQCKTLLWNGPFGVFEIKPFDNGTNILAKCAADLTKSGDLISVAGGGDTVSALENSGYTEDFSYISSAGGAFLEWLEGKSLPGVLALSTEKQAA